MIPRKYNSATQRVPKAIDRAVKELIVAACTALEVNKNCVVKKNRHRPCVDARLIIVGIIRAKFDKQAPYAFIGEKFNRVGKNKHLFGMQANKFFNRLLKKDAEFREKYLKVIRMMPKGVLPAKNMEQDKRIDCKND